MTAAGVLPVNHRSSTHNNRKSTSNHSLKRHRRQANQLTSRHSLFLIHIDKFIMSKALIRELDLKMQQVKEYGLIAHGYHNENVQYPVHVRRSHDGEKVPRSLPSLDRHHRPNCSTNSTVLTSSSHENQNSLSKRKPSSKKTFLTDELQQRTFVAPPNKTVDDIDPSIDRDHSYTTGTPPLRLHHPRKSSSSSATSSPTLCSSRPHSIACLSTTDTVTTTADSSDSAKTDEETSSSHLQSSQSLTIPTTTTTSRTPRRTLTQKFFSKLFHSPSKS